MQGLVCNVFHRYTSGLCIIYVAKNGSHWIFLRVMNRTKGMEKINLTLADLRDYVTVFLKHGSATC